MTTVNLASGAAKAAPSRMTLRLGAMLLAHEGVLPYQEAVAFAEQFRTGGRVATRMVADALRPLVHAGVVVARDNTLYVPKLADLAAWLADGLEYREDAGIAGDPVLPPAIPRQHKSGRRSAAA